MNVNKKFYFEERLLEKKYEKSQIILTNTSIPIDDHLSRLELTHNKEYINIPTYTVSLDGDIYNHFNPLLASNYMGKNIDNKAITVSLENLGWLSYDLQSDVYYNWCGCFYYDEPIQMSWKGKYFWSKYSDKQVFALLELLNYLFMKYSIKKDFIGHNSFINKAVDFEGVLNRSNYNNQYYDLSPAMDFNDLYYNLVDNEKK